jgi:membrane-bound lytic murein transglycosylase D
MLLFFVQLIAQGQSDLTKAQQDSINVVQFELDDPFIAALDSLHFESIFEASTFTDDLYFLNVHNYPLDSIPVWEDSIVIKRLQALDDASPFNLDYNQHTARLINSYSTRRRLTLSRVLGLSELYFPIFEEELEKNNLPLELKYLPIVESALNNTVRSSAGAVGLWQFMYRTGKYLGLDINSYVDERRDPIKSTKTAVKYLTYLHGLYDDWHLALAAYNAGPGNVNKAIRRSGGSKNFWVIQEFLPRETRNYVPSFIAVNYLMNHAADHNLYPIKPKFTIRHVDTVQVSQQVTFAQISEVLCMDYDDIVFLNPQYKQDFIPKSKDSIKFSLTLPVNLIGDFINNEQSIYDYKLKKEEKRNVDVYTRNASSIHQVRKGESLGVIAEQYRVKTSDLRRWNKLSRRNFIYPGQKLKVHSKVTTRQKKENKKKEITYNGYLYYTIRNGDTLWDIANLYKGISVKDIMKLNRFSSKKVLRVGMKIKIKST